MIVEESILNPVLRSIDVMYMSNELSVNDAEDLSESVLWIKGKSLNESNISYVIDTLRSFKNDTNKENVSKVINEFRKTCGSYL